MEYLDEVASEFIARHPKDCSYLLFSPAQKSIAWFLGLMAALLLAYRWDLFIILFSFLSAGAYLAVALFKLFAAFRGMFANLKKKSPFVPIPESDLPVYSILVPLFKEANVLPQLVKHLGSLEYPHTQLDILLLLEESDPETLAAAESLDLPDFMRIIRIPKGSPQTKPRACNYGLREARGTYVVIYDAEDRPEKDQLLRVLSAFHQAPIDVICMQCRLAYFNARRNWLTACFALEYATWFDYYLEGLQHMNVPLPLGGTSNHFKTEVLREIGGWDPFNVTEDCDLGIRLHKRRYRTRTVPSITWEEATSQTGNWIRQRSRWVKGYFQTFFTHMRHPLRTFKGLGFPGFLGFLLVVGGHSFLLVLNLVFWMLLALYLFWLGMDVAAGREIWEVIAGEKEAVRQAWKMIYWGPGEHKILAPLSVGFFAVSCVLLFSNFLFILLGLLAAFSRNRWKLIPAALTMPVYWVLISIGAWKGFLQLFTRPHYWEKTRHGIDVFETTAQEPTP
ncbi:glycosyltransferase [Kiritimatiellaeota bacterium B1221]|nr:glycosyltransferase [Kiritimatiellaeota bacterium B1221]